MRLHPIVLAAACLLSVGSRPHASDLVLRQPNMKVSPALGRLHMRLLDRAAPIDARQIDLGEGEVPWPGTDPSMPMDLFPGACDVIATASGNQHSLALKSDGTVWAWGWNSPGSLGDGTTTQRNTPVQVLGPGGIGFLTGVTSIAVGTYHSLALKSDGTVWAWGPNSQGELGDGTIVNRLTPVQVLGSRGVGFLTGVARIGAGDRDSLALKTDGTVWTWGDNLYGALGDGTTTDSVTPVQVRGTGGIGFLTGVTGIAGGGIHSLALKSDGTASVWGSNASGQLGDGTMVDRLTPVQVLGSGGVGFLTGVTAIDGGDNHTLALKSDGTAWVWGWNGQGHLGDGTFLPRLTPVQVLGPGGVGFLTGVARIAAGNSHSVALESDGTVWAWGDNGVGELGDGTTTDRLTPVQVLGPGGGGFLTGIAGITAGRYQHSLALKCDGTVWAWGSNFTGELGDGTTTGRTTPVQTLMPCDPCGTNVIAIDAGYAHSLVLKSDGTVWAWGDNGVGELGDGTTTDRLTPVQVVGPRGIGFLTGVTSIAGGDYHSLALKSDGTVWAWGENFYGTLGDGTTTRRTTPVQVLGAGGVGFLTDVTGIAGGRYHSLALKSDGTVWAWGDNGFGQLGDGTQGPWHAPSQVLGAGGIGFLTGVARIAAGMKHSLALKTDGTVWAWGGNGHRELGDGTTAQRNTPVQVLGPGGVGFLTSVAGIAGGHYHPLALKSDGTVWAWGDNTNGQLGDGTTTDRSTPVQVLGPGGGGFLTGVTRIAVGNYHSLALDSEGTVWGWGYNLDNELGDGTTTERHAPVQVLGFGGIGFLTGVARIAAGAGHSLALQSDGPVWAWGYNLEGSLGDGTTTNRPTPVQPAFAGGGSALSLTCPSDRTIDCPGDTSPTSTGSPSTSGGGCGTITSFLDAVVPGCGSTRTIARTWTASDGIMSASCVQTITVVDTTPPTLTPGTLAACYSTRAALEAAAIAATIATDTCAASVALTAFSTGTCDAVVTVVGTDLCGNTGTTTYATRIDGTPPVLTPGMIASCYTTAAAAETAAIAATGAADDCLGSVTMTASTSGTRSATVTVTGTDSCGNAAATTYATRADGTPVGTSFGSLYVRKTAAGCTLGSDVSLTWPTSDYLPSTYVTVRSQEPSFGGIITGYPAPTTATTDITAWADVGAACDGGGAYRGPGGTSLPVNVYFYQYHLRDSCTNQPLPDP